MSVVFRWSLSGLTSRLLLPPAASSIVHARAAEPYVYAEPVRGGAPPPPVRLFRRLFRRGETCYLSPYERPSDERAPRRAPSHDARDGRARRDRPRRNGR